MSRSMRIWFAVPICSASACSAGPKPWSRRTTGSSANERSRSSRIVARCRSSAVASTLLRVVELAGLDRVQRRVEHQRDPGEVLYRAVVQEQRDAPALVLLGGDQPVEPVGRSRDSLNR